MKTRIPVKSKPVRLVADHLRKDANCNDMVEFAQTGLEEEHWLADQNCQNWSAWLGPNGSSPLGFFP